MNETITYITTKVDKIQLGRPVVVIGRNDLGTAPHELIRVPV